ncbi:2-C-methyl-D-erythritol 2,4-cyclodiphosphate synthase [Thioalkalivibrio sp. HK1]|uniref:2-C-methyl-D-erythritol 2,4-cyclodiphosphate synthase n=1 Tax=Thioalkalivibrio sp. HK1 TaxID=1469245 RepID=UPI00047097A0|nr:2-C-methyl-D-erythritol 2,4-cyclodiphosphate synthase [Thioalkalivibrio sp. HK1]
MRIGHGYDAHRFSAQTDLTLGGVAIEFDRGLAAHSDGDVLIHALCDALLGAAGQGDIGRHFPDSDSRFENIDSRILLRRTVAMLSDLGWEAANVDATLIAQVPRLSPYLPKMRRRLAADLGISESALNIKATTTEGMGFAGREEGIAAHAVVLIRARS